MLVLPLLRKKYYKIVLRINYLDVIKHNLRNENFSIKSVIKFLNVAYCFEKQRLET